jgi:hypothetical protein
MARVDGSHTPGRLKMTTRKSELPLPIRTPVFVSRDVGAAELQISPETWDRWVDEGILPQPSPGFPHSTPRWKWADVERKLTSAPDSIAVDPFIAGAERIKDGTAEKK